LNRTKDTLMGQLRDLAKQKTRGQTDENLMADIGRIESATTLAKDDLVRIFISSLLVLTPV
jgi:structural maintenance of chromosome 1